MTIAPYAPDWCIHFNGVQNKTCKAGISYETVRDKSVRPWRLPCILTEHGCKTACEQLVKPTEEQVAAYEAGVAELVKSFVEAHSKGRCPHCSRLIESERQVGRCVYSEPCGCRLWQGRARSTEALREAQGQ